MIAIWVLIAIDAAMFIDSDRQASALHGQYFAPSPEQFKTSSSYVSAVVCQAGRI